MNVEDNRTTYVGTFETGDVVVVGSGHVANYFHVVEETDGTYRLVDLETGDLYHRKIASFTHLKNHLEKHFDKWKLIKSARVKLVIE